MSAVRGGPERSQSKRSFAKGLWHSFLSCSGWGRASDRNGRFWPIGLGRMYLAVCVVTHNRCDGATSLDRVHPARFHTDHPHTRAGCYTSGFAPRLEVQA